MRTLKFLVAISLATISASPLATADDARSRYAEPFTPEWAAPQLQIFPEAGTPGSLVEIRGARFRPDARVFFGDQQMPVIEIRGRTIRAMIPRYVRGYDFIYVMDRTGRARSVVAFEVMRQYRYREPRDRDPR